MPSAGVQASAAILRVARELRTALDQRFAPIGLTSQQAGLLIHVFTGQTAAQRLAELLGSDSAGITRMVDRLETKGYVVRTPDSSDRRANRVDLTEAGRALVPQLPGVFEEVAAEFLRGIDAGRVGADLDAMLSNLRELAARPVGQTAARAGRGGRGRRG